MDRALTPGDNYREEILRQIQQCSAFIPVLSKSVEQRERGLFRREWSVAKDHAAEFTGTNRKFVFPVVVNGTPLKQIKVVREEFFGRTACESPSGDPPPELVRELQVAVEMWREQAGAG